MAQQAKAPTTTPGDCIAAPGPHRGWRETAPSQLQGDKYSEYNRMTRIAMTGKGERSYCGLESDDVVLT